jgi:ribulose-5-phosphate 4-epimerase/fuculose-1-phosphate aldolase
MIDEGYIKFHSDWSPGPPPSDPGLAELISVRNLLFDTSLIGVYPDSGIGYGNVSLRTGTNGGFIISGTRTGSIAELGPEHFCLVSETDISANSVRCQGPVEASSESMTHAMIYKCDPAIRSVVHVHHLGMWQWLHDKVPLSGPAVPYGTPEMAGEVDRLFRKTDLPVKRIMAMGGHEEGIISFGSSPEDAVEVIYHWFKKWQKKG